MVENRDFLPTNAQEIGPELQELPTPEGELHLRFYLSSHDEFALPATAIREVMQQPIDRITPIPNASPLLLGAINLRGQVIWVADLGQFLGDRLLLNTDRAEIPIIAIEDSETILGLAVEGLGETKWLDIKNLQRARNVSDHAAPYVQGEWAIEQEDSQQVLRLLDGVAILRSARWVA
jgi:twitching motility protein PilI